MSWREGRTKVPAHFYRSFRCRHVGCRHSKRQSGAGLSPIALYSCSRNTCP
jgi:hypothetical protein